MRNASDESEGTPVRIAMFARRVQSRRFGRRHQRNPHSGIARLPLVPRSSLRASRFDDRPTEQLIMWRRSIALRAAAARSLQQQQLAAPRSLTARWMSTALSPEEQELLNEPREGMDYDVLLVRLCACACRFCVFLSCRIYIYASTQHTESTSTDPHPHTHAHVGRCGSRESRRSDPSQAAVGRKGHGPVGVRGREGRRSRLAHCLGQRL